ncbi:Peptidase inhibitor I9 [Lachnospiraceae bacterium XBB1006]|nr:Peptidase inhibitor I9 [Lachnospiraceae bacterium XBB1006]
MKKALSLLLSATMVLGMTQQATMFAHAENQEKGVVKGPGYEIHYGEVKGSQREDTFKLNGFHIDPDKRVSVIVKFKEESLVDKFLKSNNKEYGDYADSHAKTVAKVENKVDTMVEKVEAATDLKGTKNDAEVKDTYSVVFTGCSVEVPFKQIEKIQEMDGVEEVFLEHTYELPKTDFKVETKPNMLTSHEMIGSKEAWENGTGYDGTGTAIAVLDTGIDLYHEAFTTMPTNPKLSAEDIQKVLDSNDMEAEKGAATYSKRLVANPNGGDDSVYKNAKIPFAFDYVDNDTDIVPVHTQYHGTHVSGTVAGNCEKMKGVAPNAQLIGMKVFPDAGGAMDGDIINALEDCVRLDLDSINMSLGTSSGFAKYGDSALEEAYEAVERVGINLNISAGNSYNSALGNNHNHLEPASLPDEGIVGSPSTLKGALSVAAINNTHLGLSNFIELKNSVVGFSDGGKDSTKPFTKLSKGTYAVVDCGKGTPEDFAKVNVKNKVAMIQRGENTFQEKHDNAAKAGAAAAIVYNNTSGSLTMSIENYRIPCVFVTAKDGKKIIEEGEFKFDPDKRDNVANPDAWTMCDFSSIGSTPSLEIKPEITAPGGSIYSAFYSDKKGNGYDSVYGTISGTSMASPHIAGGTAIVREYVNKNFKGLDRIKTTQLVNNLTMSTAKPVTQQDGTFYLVRKQGAGIMQIDHAIKTPAYLTVAGQERPKAEVGYNEKGEYTYTVTVHNMSDRALTYNLKTTALAEQTQEVEGEKYTTEVAEDITKNCEISYKGAQNGKVTVAAGGTADVTVTVALDMNSARVKELQADYVNGFFVEGFTQFTSDTEVALSVPFMGFCGDWAKAPVFDSTIYDKDKKPEYGEGSKLGLHISGSECETAGINVFKANHGLGTEYAEQCLCIKGTDRLVPLTNLLRGAEKMTYTIKDENGKVVFDQSDNYIGKTYYTGSDETPFACAEYWMKVTPIFEPGKGAKDGEYTLTETAVVGGTNGKETQALTYHFAIDSSLPVYDMDRCAYYEEDGERYLRLSVSDNHGLAGVSILDERYDTFDDYSFCNVSFDYKTEAGSDKREIVLALGDAAKLKRYGAEKSLLVQTFDLANNYQKKKIYFGEKPADIDNPNPEKLAATKLTKVENTGVGEMTLTYDKVSMATGYEIYRAEGKGEFAKIGDTNKTVYVDKNATKKGETYSYKVVAYNEKEKAEDSNVLSAVSEMENAPVEPKELASTEVLSVTNTAYGTMKVDYTDVAGATGYKVLRAEEDGEFEVLGTTEENYYIDKTATKVGTTYNYKVIAFNDEQEAKESNVKSAVSVKEKPQTGLEAPTLVKAVNTKKGTIELEWEKVEGANGYMVYRAINDGGFVEVDSTSATKYKDTSAKKYGQTYRYYVVAYNWSHVFSEPSNIVECENEIGGLKVPTITNAYYDKENKRVVLEFEEDANAARYVIFRAVDDEASLHEWAKADGSPWEDRWELEEGHTYSYRIQAEGYEKDNFSKPSNEVHVKVTNEDEPGEPEQPTLDAAVLKSVENTGIGEMTVTFEAVEGATGYRVYRSVDAGMFEQVADVTGTTYVDAAATQTGSVYAYYVVAYNEEVEAEKSETMSAVSEKVAPLTATTITKVENTAKYTMTITFEPVYRAEGYHVYGKAGNGAYELLGDTTDTTYVAKNATKLGETYTYKVVAFTSKEEGPQSNEMGAKSEIGLLKAAEVTKVENTAINEMTVTFKAVEGATNYKVLRSVDGSAFAQVADVTETKYVDKKANKTGSTYAYKVVAYNEETEAEESNVMSAVSAKKAEEIGQVTGFSVKRHLVKFYNISWNKVKGATGYELYRKEKGDSYEMIDRTSLTFVVDVPSLKKNKTFTYKVRAYKTVNGKKVYGKFSKEITITTKGLLF